MFYLRGKDGQVVKPRHDSLTKAATVSFSNEMTMICYWFVAD